MRLVFGLVMLIGIALAGAAVYLARDYIGEHQAKLAAAEAAKSAIVPVTDIYVVNKRMNYGQRLTKGDVKSVRWPTSAIPNGAFTNLEDLFPDNGEELRSVLRTIEPDEAILRTKVTRPGEPDRKSVV